MLIMLNNSFHKNGSETRQLGSLCKMINLLKTIKFFTLETYHCKKRKNANSKKYTLSVLSLPIGQPNSSLTYSLIGHAKYFKWPFSARKLCSVRMFQLISGNHFTCGLYILVLFVSGYRITVHFWSFVVHIRSWAWLDLLSRLAR